MESSDNSPSIEMASPTSGDPIFDAQTEPSEKVRLKKELGLVDGVAISVGVIVGSGIFISPKGVLENAGSIGASVVVWIMSGFLSTIGALCYAELGTMIPRSGGDYAYLSESFGSLPAFLYMWSALFVIMPAGNAVIAITFAHYLLKFWWIGCDPPIRPIRLLAAVVIMFLTALNCYNVKWVKMCQDVFTLAKVFALVCVISCGIFALFSDDYDNLKAPMEGTKSEIGYVALSFYSGIFTFSGWNYLNFVTEEIKNPYKNLPRAICISLPLVTVIYVLVNFAYFIVLTKDEILSSDAVAVTFGEKMLGKYALVIPLFVSCSTFGSLNGNIFTSSRLFFVGSQYGHLPEAIALINVKRFTPIPSLIFLGILTVAYLCIEKVETLINYAAFVESVFTLLSICGLLWLRRVKPGVRRPIRVNLIFPILYFSICALLVTLPFYVQPMDVGIGFLIIVSGVPFFIFFILYAHQKPKWISDAGNSLNLTCAKLFVCVPEEGKSA